jgi:hypothetical protein
MLQRVKFAAFNHYNMVIFFDTCWYSEPVSCIDFGLYPATYLSRIWKAFGLMVELAVSSERFRDDVRDCTVSTRNAEFRPYNRLQVHVLMSVEVVVVVFGRWVAVHSNMQFWKSRPRALVRMVYKVDRTKKTVELVWRRYFLQLLFAFIHGSCKEVKRVLHIISQEVDCVEFVLVSY